MLSHLSHAEAPFYTGGGQLDRSQGSGGHVGGEVHVPTTASAGAVGAAGALLSPLPGITSPLQKKFDSKALKHRRSSSTGDAMPPTPKVRILLQNIH